MNIELRPIERYNFAECAGLTVRPEQERFVGSNLHSIAEAYAFPEFVPRAIYNDETMVGFLMYGFGDRSQQWWIIRLMIDQQHQGKGYGRAAMRAMIDQLHALPNCTQIAISYELENEVVRKLYSSLGFQETGEIINGEVLARLHFTA